MSLETPKSAHKNDSAPFRILIVDDHPIVREGYAQLIGLQPDLEVCGFAATISEALEQVKQLQPHLAVIDVSLKEGSGIELIKQIRTDNHHLKMLVISAHDEGLFAERALNAGAMGYINKQEATEKLITGIRQVLKDEVFVSEQVANRMLRRRVGGKDPEDPSRLSSLSNRELEVLRLVGQGQATRRIASQLGLSPKTVDRYKENIKTKLKLANATELIQFATQWVLANP